MIAEEHLKRLMKFIQSKFELMWYKYDDLQKGQYPLADVVIIHFDKDRIQDATMR